MKKIDLSGILLDHSGKPTTQTMASALSEILGTEMEGKTLKLYGWHKVLQTGTSLSLDDSDKQDLKKLIEESKRVFIYMKGQFLEAIESGKA